MQVSNPGYVVYTIYGAAQLHAMDATTTSRQFLRVERRFCEHCGQSVSIKTYKVHRRLYFNEITNKEGGTGTAAAFPEFEESPPNSGEEDVSSAAEESIPPDAIDSYQGKYINI